MAFDGTLKFDTALDQSGFKNGITKLGGIAKAGMKAVTGAITAATGAVVGLETAAVKVGSDFEGSMAQVIATMGITKDTVQDGVNSFDLLSQAAQDAGANTTFSASEAADALNYLALAGYDAATAADALPAVLDLAAAGGLDLAYASDLATDEMAALGIEASKENLTAFGDAMAKTASKANTSVSQLGEAILTVGGTAKTLAGGTTELNTALGVLANRGIKGAEGGTHLRNMILSLSAPTENARKVLGSLGVSALDADGNMRPMNETFADLAAAMDGMSDGDRANILSDIFNKTDLAAAQALMAGCGEEFASLAAEIDNADGAMAQMAKTMNDTLEGDMKSLQSRAEALGIAVYGSLNDPLRDLAQTGGGYLTTLTDAFNTSGFSGAAQALGDVLSQAVTKAGDCLPDIVQLGVSVVSALSEGLIANSDRIMKTGIDLALTLLSSFGETTADMLELGAGILQSLAEGIEKRLPRIRRIARQTLKLLADSLSENLPLMLEAGISVLETLSEVFIENLPLLVECANTIIQSLVKALSDPEMLNALLGAGLAILESLLQIIGDNADLLIAAAIQIVETLGVWIADHAVELATAAIELVTVIVSAILEHANELNEAAFAIIRAVVDNLTEPEQMEKLMHAAGELIREFFKGLGTYGTELGEFTFDLFEALGNALGEIDWAQLGKAIVEGICSGLLGTDFDLNSYLSEFGDNWVSGIKDIFGIHSPSKLMRDQIGKNLALGVGEGFVEEMPDVGLDALDAFRDMEHELLPDAGEMRYTLTPEIDSSAFDAMREVRTEIDASAFEALREIVPEMAASRYIDPPASAKYITNYDTSYITNSENHAAPEPAAPGGDIIIPVSIGGQQLDTIVIKAAQIANARSGGVTL